MRPGEASPRVTRFAWWLLCGIAALSCPASGAPVDGFARIVRPVTSHVWLIQRPVATDAPFEGNVVVVEQSDGLVVVDAGGAPPAGRHVARLIGTISTKSVKAIVYTHYHGDHNLGAGELLKRWPRAQVISTDRTRQNMLGAPMAYIKTYAASYRSTAEFARRQSQVDSLSESERRGWGRFAAAGPSMVAGYTGLAVYPATITFADRLTLHDAEAPVELMFLGRANTDGDAVAWMPAQRVLASGDIVVHPIPYASACFVSEWLTVLKRIEALPYAFLVPGHGEVQTDGAYVRKLESALTEVRAQVDSLAGQGLALADVRKRTRLEAVRSAFTGDDGWLRVVFDNVFLGAIVKNAYQEVKGDSIVQGGS